VTDWPLVSLGGAGITVIDCDHRTPPAASSGYPYVAIPQMRDGRLDFSTARRIKPEDYVAWTRKALPQENDVVLSRRCNPGDTAYVPANVEFAVGQNLLLLRSDGTKVYPSFLRWIVRGAEWWSQVAKYINVGAVFDSLRLPDILNFTLHLPPIAEQRGIAYLLGAIDAKVESNARVAAGARACLRALAKTLAGLPSAPLSTLVRASRETLDPHDLGSARIEHFSIPAFDAGTMPDVSPASSIKSGKFAIRGPRVLVSRLNPRTPRVWYAVPSLDTAVASTEFLVLEGPDSGPLAAVWLAVTGESFTAEMQQRATGTSGSHQRVRPADALAIEVPNTARAEPAVLDEAEALLRVMHQRQVESSILADLREALLSELLSGRVRVPEARQYVEAIV
jgi:type I restriction enzyme S subunit